MDHRVHVVIPQDLVHEIDLWVGKRGRSAFLVDAASRELKRLKQLKTLQAATGAWTAGRHPELKAGSLPYVRDLRRQNENRFPKRSA